VKKYIGKKSEGRSLSREKRRKGMLKGKRTKKKGLDWMGDYCRCNELDYG